MNWQSDLQLIVQSQAFKKCTVMGAALALALVSILLLVISKGNIGPLMLVPLSFVTVGGALGGSFYSLMDLIRVQGTWQRMGANALSGLVYLLTCYLSLVYALSLTGHWN